MFHMLSCFNLKQETTIDEFQRSLADFTAHLENIDLVHSTGPIGRRRSNTIMDTDGERDHQYFFIMSFRGRAQCEQAVEHIFRHEEPGESIHRGVYAKVDDPIFVCWEDI